MAQSLALVLPQRQKLPAGTMRLCPMPRFRPSLPNCARRETIPALALEFLILTAARAGEVLGATWGRDRLRRAGLDHSRFPHEGRPFAIAFLCQLVPWRSSSAWPKSGPAILYLPGSGGGAHWPARHLPRLYQVRRFTVSARPSGIGRAKKQASRARSPSRRWRTRLAMRSKQAYRRGDALEKRRALMQAWASFCERGRNVFQIRAAT